MKAFNLIVGCGREPEGYSDWKHIESFEELSKYKAIIGEIRLHLYGQWESKISPEQIRQLLVNWYANKIQPVVTISL